MTAHCTALTTPIPQLQNAMYLAHYSQLAFQQLQRQQTYFAKWQQLPSFSLCNCTICTAADTSLVLAAFAPQRWLLSYFPPFFCEFSHT
jgi:hypothetical protein